MAPSDREFQHGLATSPLGTEVPTGSPGAADSVVLHNCSSAGFCVVILRHPHSLRVTVHRLMDGLFNPRVLTMSIQARLGRRTKAALQPSKIERIPMMIS